MIFQNPLPRGTRKRIKEFKCAIGFKKDILVFKKYLSSWHRTLTLTNPPLKKTSNSSKVSARKSVQRGRDTKRGAN